MRFFEITGFLMASFYPENEFQKAINAEMNPKIPVYLQRSSASSPPRRSRVFQWSPGWPSAGAATSAWCNRCRRTQLLHRQTNKGQTDLMLLINMIKCFYKSNKLSCTNYYTKIFRVPVFSICCLPVHDITGKPHHSVHFHMMLSLIHHRILYCRRNPHK